MSHYILKEKYSLPGFVFLAITSWVGAFGGVTIILLVDWGVSAVTKFQLIKSMPGPLTSFLDLCGAYAALGAFCLYMTMWVYWIAVERSSFFARIAWLLALLFGLPWGALIYALVVWRKDLRKVDGSQPIRHASVAR